MVLFSHWLFLVKVREQVAYNDIHFEDYNRCFKRKNYKGVSEVIHFEDCNRCFKRKNYKVISEVRGSSLNNKEDLNSLSHILGARLKDGNKTIIEPINKVPIPSKFDQLKKLLYKYVVIST